MYNDYKDRADFLAVYIREAHPTDEWEMKKNLDENVCYAQPKTLAQRVAVANDFTQRFHFPLPLGIDAMSDLADHLYAGWPERLYVIDESGKIVYRGGLGPFNYHPNEVRAWLAHRFPAAQQTATASAPQAKPRASVAPNASTASHASSATAHVALQSHAPRAGDSN